MNSDAIESPRWNPDRSGTYSEQCERGRVYFEKARTKAKLDGNLIELLFTIEGMVLGGKFHAVEIGFISELFETNPALNVGQLHGQGLAKTPPA